MSSQTRPRGFTLVEMLVVMAIIAVLAGLVLASVSAARKSAHGAAGSINLRSLAQLLSAYTNDYKGDYLNPFTPVERVAPNGDPLTWTHCVSTGPDREVWNFEGPYTSYRTEQFSSYWASYLADYRGAPRFSPELFSPADPRAAEFTKDFEVMNLSARAHCLVGSSFLYSPAFWIKPEHLGYNEVGPARLRTANVAGVLFPSKKVLVWDSMDFSTFRTPIVYAAPQARPNVVTADGTQVQVVIADILGRAAGDLTLSPLKPMLEGGPGIRCPDHIPSIGPDLIPPVPPGFFAYTYDGVRGRDLP